MNPKELWNRAVAFHGHSCPGLAIGYRAALYAAELLDLKFSDDEQTVCVSENDSCGVDAIQVILGCSAGKGNLLFRLRGKQAYAFYNRATGLSVRLVLRPKPREMGREEAFDYYQNCSNQDMFEVKAAAVELPEGARRFSSCRCDRCGEMTASNWLRLDGDKKLCLDCYREYNRFNL